MYGVLISCWFISKTPFFFVKQVGGNGKARQFLEGSPDFKPGLTIPQKYNTKAASMYRQKVSPLQGMAINRNSFVKLTQVTTD